MGHHDGAGSNYYPDISAKKVLNVAEPIIKEYKLKKERVALIGGDGGASVHVHYIAAKQQLQYKIAEQSDIPRK